jgi:hypothetical protein
MLCKIASPAGAHQRWGEVSHSSVDGALLSFQASSNS